MNYLNKIFMFHGKEAKKLLLNRSRRGKSRGHTNASWSLLNVKFLFWTTHCGMHGAARYKKKRLKGLPKFLEMQNRVLAQNFWSKVLNHKKYLGLPTKKAYTPKIYHKLFSDSAHFKENVYNSLVQWVARRHLLIDWYRILTNILGRYRSNRTDLLRCKFEQGKEIVGGTHWTRMLFKILL